MSTDTRVDELEARLALQDQSILELSDEVYKQQRQIAELERRLATLANQVKAVVTPAPAPENEVPPHY